MHPGHGSLSMLSLLQRNPQPAGIQQTLWALPQHTLSHGIHQPQHGAVRPPLKHRLDQESTIPDYILDGQPVDFSRGLGFTALMSRRCTNGGAIIRNGRHPLTLRVGCKSWACRACAEVKKWRFKKMCRFNAIVLGQAAFITLTFREAESRTSSQAWVRRCKEKIVQFLKTSQGHDITYLIVPENTRKGQLHFHMTVSPWTVWHPLDRQRYNTLKDCQYKLDRRGLPLKRHFGASCCLLRAWTIATAATTRWVNQETGEYRMRMPKAPILSEDWIPLTEGSSYITDVQLARSARGVGGYMGKYLSKTFAHKLGRGVRRWATSRNFIRPSSTRVMGGSLIGPQKLSWTRGARALLAESACCRDRSVTFFPTSQQRTVEVKVGQKRVKLSIRSKRRLRIYDFKRFGLDSSQVARRLREAGQNDVARALRGREAALP